jgi:hypothetical protein
MSLQIQQNRWEVEVEVKNDKGVVNKFKVELVYDGYCTGVVRVVYAVGGWPVRFASKDWGDAVAASVQVKRPDFPVVKQDYIGGDGESW